MLLHVSVLFNEPKLLKSRCGTTRRSAASRFSALQRAEIAEMARSISKRISSISRFSALQRAEIAEIERRPAPAVHAGLVSVLFNEPKLLKYVYRSRRGRRASVSVLFNEPKLLKSFNVCARSTRARVSVLFNEPKLLKFQTYTPSVGISTMFQCSSTSRNC